MKQKPNLRPDWAAEFTGQKVRDGIIEMLASDGRIEVCERDDEGEYDLLFPTLLKCLCPMNESKACVTITLQDDKLADVTTEFLAYVFNPPSVGWEHTGKRCAGKDDAFAKAIIASLIEEKSVSSTHSLKKRSGKKSRM